MQILRTAIRAITAGAATIFTLVVIYKASLWVRSGELDPIQVLHDSPFLLLSTASWIAVVVGPRRAVYSVLFGFLSGLLLGVISAILGFVVPELPIPQPHFMREVGPAFGIFFAGPIGFVVGMIAGAIYSAARHRPQGNPTRSA
ncbi:MAG TPA: hypothetical protein VGQ36_26950 [Thermoanaerobaculia bacterium]|nr:hypothetical protein [Thermoanaerobaculia bacterium]